MFMNIFLPKTGNAGLRVNFREPEDQSCMCISDMFPFCGDSDGSVYYDDFTTSRQPLGAFGRLAKSIGLVDNDSSFETDSCFTTDS